MPTEATPEEVVQSISQRVTDVDVVTLDTLIADTVREYTNHWEVTDCFDVIDNSERVSARQIGERHRQGELSPVGGDTTIEREIRYWAAVELVERGLDHVGGDIVTETVGV